MEFDCRQQISTAEYVDKINSKRRRRLYQSTYTPRRTEQNLYVRIGKSEVIDYNALGVSHC